MQALVDENDRRIRGGARTPQRLPYLRLNPEQLPAALARGLAPIYLVSGDEPLLVGEAADAIRAAARASGYADRTVFFIERSFAWDDLRHATQALSLFAERRLFELRMPSGKPDKGAAQLAEIATQPPPDVVCLIITDKLDRKASEAPWVRAIETPRRVGPDLAGGCGGSAGMAASTGASLARRDGTRRGAADRRSRRGKFARREAGTREIGAARRRRADQRATGDAQRRRQRALRRVPARRGGRGRRCAARTARSHRA